MEKIKNKKLVVLLALMILMVLVLAYFQLLYKPRQVNNGFATLSKKFSHHRSDVWVTRFVPGLPLLLASCSVDGTVQFINIKTGQAYRIFRHPDGVTYFEISSDGQLLATTSYDRLVRIWKIADGSLLKTLSGHTKTPWSVSFSPDGNTLISSGEDGSIKIWNIENGSLLETISGHDRTVWDVKFSPDGKTFASGSFDTKVKIWNAVDGSLNRTFDAHTQAVTALAYSHKGNLLATASDDKTIKIWDLEKGKMIKSLEVPEHAQGVCFSPDDKRLVTSGRDKIMIGEFMQNLFGNSEFNRGLPMRLWDVASGQLLQTFCEQTNDVNDVTFSADGKWIASASADHTVDLWEVLK